MRFRALIVSVINLAARIGSKLMFKDVFSAQQGMEVQFSCTLDDATAKYDLFDDKTSIMQYQFIF